MTFSLPNEFLKRKIHLELTDATDMNANILQWNEHWIVVEGEKDVLLIPWSRIMALSVPREKEASS